MTMKLSSSRVIVLPPEEPGIVPSGTPEAPLRAESSAVEVVARLSSESTAVPPVESTTAEERL